MRFAWYLVAGALACFSPLLGCASVADDSRLSSSGTGGGQLEKTSITLDSDKTIDLKPGEAVMIGATVRPGGKHAIGFALLGDAADAALDATVVHTNADGVAETRLHAPSVATTFLLRATLIGDADVTDTVAVAVSSKGFATIEAAPHYSGVRQVTSWTATAISRTTCAALAPMLPDVPPGGLETTGAAKQNLVIHDVPVGPPIAVVVRAGHFAFGCVDSPPLVPNTTAKLGITVIDRPLDLAATKLDFALDFAPDPVDLAALTADGLQVVETKVFNQSQDAGFLLDAMQALAPAGFYEARTANGWDMATMQHLEGLGVDLHAEVEAWTYAGLGIQPPTLAVRVRGSDILAGSLEAHLTILQLGSFSPAEAGFPKTINDASWLAQTNDVVQLGASVPWRPSALIAASALVGARVEYPGVATVGDALALGVDCTGLGTTLGGYTGCDGSCLATFCTAALESAWIPAATASPAPGSNESALAITVVGQAQVDDTAVPISVEGMWVGSLRDPTTQANMMGAATATKTGSHPPP